MKHMIQAALGAVVTAFWASASFAVGTPVGTSIDNVAEVTFELGGTTLTQSSNPVSITVEEILDLNLLAQTPQRSVQAGDPDQWLLFTLTNTGNGTETFQLSSNNVVAGDDFDPAVPAVILYFDTDSSGDLSPADIAYVPGTNDPDLAADASVDILVVYDIPAGLPDGSRGVVELSATAATGSGNPGDVFAGLGDGGIDAVVGANGATATAAAEYVVGNVQLDLMKSAVVNDPFGGNESVPGATIVYTVTVTATGTGTAVNSVFRDAIPVNTTFLAGSILLNGAGLTDASADDAGEFTTSPDEVVVTLGDLTAAGVAPTIQFSVTID
jgi:uncharacterized repeat protein (TIGR01451 family)